MTVSLGVEMPAYRMTVFHALGGEPVTERMVYESALQDTWIMLRREYPDRKTHKIFYVPVIQICGDAP